MLIHYPAVFEDSKDFGCSVVFPDLNYLATEGKTYDEAMSMAVECLAGYVWELERSGDSLPEASKINDLTLENDEFSVYIGADTDNCNLMEFLLKIGIMGLRKWHPYLILGTYKEGDHGKRI